MYFKLIGDDVYDILKSKEAAYRDKIRLCMYFTDIKNIFRVYDEKIAVEMFEMLLDDFDAIPSILQKCIRDKIIPDFDRLIASMQDGLIARTSNQCENYYRQTDPGEIKHKYRTSRGILAYLAEAVTLRGAGTVLVAACPMPLLTNTVSGRRSFHKQPPEFCI